MALAPKRSTTVWIRAISLACSTAFLASRSSSRARERSVLAVRALVLDELADGFLGRSIEMQHTSDRLVEQIDVVTDHEQRTAVGAQELQQPHLGVDVEVVRRLVEQQDVGTGEQDSRQLDTPPLATTEHADRQLQPIARQTETGGHRAGLALCAVATRGARTRRGPGCTGRRCARWRLPPS